MTDSTLNNQLNEEESFDFSEITNYDKIKYQPANVFNNGTQKNISIQCCVLIMV